LIFGWGAVKRAEGSSGMFSLGWKEQVEEDFYYQKGLKFFKMSTGWWGYN
jgi:hypothetical protein